MFDKHIALNTVGTKVIVYLPYTLDGDAYPIEGYVLWSNDYHMCYIQLADNRVIYPQTYKQHKIDIVTIGETYSTVAAIIERNIILTQYLSNDV